MSLDESLGLTQSYHSPQMGSPQAFTNSSQFQPSTNPYSDFKTPLPIKTPAPPKSYTGDLLTAVETIQNLQRNMDEKFQYIEERLGQMANVQKSSIHSTQGAQSIVHSANTPATGKLLQVSDDMIVISPQQLEHLVEEKVQLKLRRYEEQARNAQQLEARVRQLEESLINYTFRPANSQSVVQNLPAQNPYGFNATNTMTGPNYLANSVGTSLQERLERVSAQINQVGSQLGRK